MRTTTLVGIVLSLAACGSDIVGPAPAPVTVTGAYNLATVDGQALPFTVLDLGDYKAKLASATLDLKSNGTYRFEFGIRIEDSGNIRSQSDLDDGVWTRAGNGITLTSNVGTVTRTGDVSGGVLTLRGGPSVFRLTKQRP